MTNETRSAARAVIFGDRVDRQTFARRRRAYGRAA